MNAARLLSGALALVPFSVRTRIHQIPGVAPLQRWVVARLGRGDSFAHRISAGPAKGLMFGVKLPEDKLYWAGHWEAEVTGILARAVRPGAVCYDIGGHRGFMAGVMALHGAAEVHCFEPNPVNAVQIEDLQALNPVLPILLHRMAIGAEDGRVAFDVMPDTAMGKLASSDFQHGRAGAKRLEVDLRRLDGLIAAGAVPPADLIKIDIEGAELEALQGAADLVAAQSPVLLIEVHSHALFQGCAAWLRARGYGVEVVEMPIASVKAEAFRVCHILARPKG